MRTIVNAFRRSWPAAGVVLALAVNAAWMSLLGYGVFKLGLWVF
jgi:hypothetical protein